MAATYTVKQVADILGYSTNSIYTFLKEKRIKAIRVGRGRFRIPQSELNRLLLVQKGSAAIVPPTISPELLKTVGPEVAPTGVVEPSRTAVINSMYPMVLPGPKVEVPSLFDWFVGIVSIVMGLAMFLFSKSHEEYAIGMFLVYLPAVGVTLIAGGFGLLLADIVGKKFSVWHRVFHIALLLAYGFYTFMLSQTADFEGVLLFGVLMAVLTITLFVGFGGIAGFALYVAITMLLLPLVGFFAPSISSFLQLTWFFPIPLNLTIFLWWLVIALLVGIVWFGYQWERRVFWVGMVGICGILVLLSMHYAGQLLWGRALFVLITGLLCLFVPVWQSLTFTHKRDRSFVFTTFGSLLVVYILVVGVLRVMQTNIVDYASRDLQNKVAYGKTLVESTISDTKTILSSSAQNDLLVNAIEGKDTPSLTNITKAMFENNNNFSWISVIAPSGEPLVTYPYNSVVNNSFGTRDYFLQAIASQRVVTSDFYETSTDNLQKKTVVIAAPIVGKKQTVIGVIIGSIDTTSLDNKLQQIAAVKDGEYFVVVDSAGKIVLHPNFGQIGLEVASDDPVRLGAAGKSGVGEGYSSDGIRSLIAYDAIDSGVTWGIGVKIPLANILAQTNAASLTVFSVMLVSILMIAVFLLSHRTRLIIAESVPEPSTVEQTPTMPTRAKHKHLAAVRRDSS